jgi:regulator of replication initiation timing
MKSQATRELAEKMYVQEQRTYAEISTVLEVSEKTLWTWGKDGNWNDKREALLRSKKALHEELYNLVRKLAKSIKENIEGGIEPSKTRADLFKNLMSSIKTSKEYEDAMKQAEEDEERENREGLTQDTFDRIEREIFGRRN